MVKYPPFVKDALKAMRQAVKKVKIEHRQKGLPICVFEKGKIVWKKV